ncbi:DCC-interacting protein 13-alpha-like, partial [Diadema setosum]|uniref:DCC-interacting protein 13-alpha-like n=1 Tax=Diadema setosum TaxID=31175 RepID=UPI003B3BA7EF
MPGIQLLRLEDAQDDSPQARSLLNIFETDALQLNKYMQSLLEVCKNVVDCENALTKATQSLSEKLGEFENWRFELGRDDSILVSTLRQFAGNVDQVSTMHTTLASSLEDTMLQPLSRFVNGDLAEIMSMQALYKANEQDHENVLSKYSKVSKKREHDTKQCIEVNDELYSCRKKLQQTAMNYYTALNLLQYKRTIGLLEPMIGYLQAHMAFVKMGPQMFTRQTEEYLSDINISVQGVMTEMSVTCERARERVRELDANNPHYYVPEPTPDLQMPPRIINRRRHQIGGYLWIRTKSGLTHKWDRQYFFIQGSNLMSQAKTEIGGSLVVDLEGCMVQAADVDDRRFVFQIQHIKDSKKIVILQAMSTLDREEWICTIRNIYSDYSGSGSNRGSIVSEDSASGQTAGSGSSSPSGSFAGTRPKQSGQAQRPTSLNNSKGMSGMDGHRPRSGSKDVPATPPPSPFESMLPDTPISFDMISPGEVPPPTSHVKASPTQRDAPPRRINPFSEPAGQIRVEQSKSSIPGFMQQYDVRFLGSMEVNRDKGLEIIMQTIRHIMAARAIHNVFRMTECNLIITSDSIRLEDPGSNTLRAYFQLKNISFWAAHQENKRLLAFITISRPADSSGRPTYTCHVFETDIAAEEICQSLSLAAEISFQAMLKIRTGVVDGAGAGSGGGGGVDTLVGGGGGG